MFDGSNIFSQNTITTTTPHFSTTLSTKIHEIMSLSVLQLSVVVALSRLEQKENFSPTFEEMFAEYIKCQPIHGTGAVDLHTRNVVLSALEHVIDLEMVAVTGMSGSTKQNYTNEFEKNLFIALI